jgi:hypothetical protein
MVVVGRGELAKKLGMTHATVGIVSVGNGHGVVTGRLPGGSSQMLSNRFMEGYTRSDLQTESIYGALLIGLEASIRSQYTSTLKPTNFPFTLLYNRCIYITAFRVLALGS